jgi:hypothetical protein
MTRKLGRKARAKPQRRLFHAGPVGKLNAHEGFVGARAAKRRARRTTRRRR